MTRSKLQKEKHNHARQTKSKNPSTKEQRRQKLLDAAWALLQTDTYEEIGIAGVARAAGLDNRLQVLSLQLLAPFMPTGLLARMGSYVMERA